MGVLDMGFNIEKLKEIAVPRSGKAIQSARERKLKRLMKKEVFMNEDFVSFDFAKKLKEKGFNKRVCEYYWETGGLSICNTPMNSNALENEFSAPIISQVLKWLREEKKIHIEISPQWQYTVYDMRCNPWIGRSDMQNYDDYTKAAIAGIEYVFDNLI